jgi:hypothetical protein
MCRRVGFSASCLYDRYGDLCHAIAAKRRQYWKAIVANRIRRLRKAVFAGVSELDRKGVYPTYPRVRSFLEPDLQKQWAELTNFLREAKRQLGMSTCQRVRCLDARRHICPITPEPEGQKSLATQ